MTTNSNRFDGLTVSQAVFQALGAASTCWSECPRGVFESDEATDIGEDLLDFLRKQVEHEPWCQVAVHGHCCGKKEEDCECNRKVLLR